MVVRANANQNASRRIYKSWTILNFKDYISISSHENYLLVASHFLSEGKFLWKARKISVDGANFYLKTNIPRKESLSSSEILTARIDMRTGPSKQQLPKKSVNVQVKVTDPSVKLYPYIRNKMNYFHVKGVEIDFNLDQTLIVEGHNFGTTLTSGSKLSTESNEGSLKLLQRIRDNSE